MYALVFNIEKDDTKVMRSANANRTANDLILIWFCLELVDSMWATGWWEAYPRDFSWELNTEVQTYRSIDRFYTVRCSENKKRESHTIKKKDLKGKKGHWPNVLK